jgi:hypothetical protein
LISLASALKSEDIIHRSPGLTAIYNEIKASKRNKILDLGSASTSSLSFFSRKSCHIHFENMNEFLVDYSDSRRLGKNIRDALEEYLHSFSENEKFDVVLTWDIFNYLDKDTFYWLINRLNTYSHADTLLHMIKYIGKDIPSSPCYFQILDHYQVKISQPGIFSKRAFPTLDSAHMLRGLSQYAIEDIYLQHNGMAHDITEQVLRYQPVKKHIKKSLASSELYKTDLVPSNSGVHNSSGVGADGLEAVHRSYGLENICTYLSGLQHANLLDLGSRITRSSDFFHEYAENVYVEDLVPSLIKPSSSNEPPKVLVRQHALRYGKDIKFDVILAWDIFNFCSREQLAFIYEKIKPHVHVGTKLVCFFYKSSELPEKPRKYYILDNKHIALVPSAKRSEAKEDFSSIALLKIFQHFQLEHPHILQPGMHPGLYEYVFCADSHFGSRVLPNR